jgi:hypothetical protein
LTSKYHDFAYSTSKNHDLRTFLTNRLLHHDLDTTLKPCIYLLFNIWVLLCTNALFLSAYFTRRLLILCFLIFNGVLKTKSPRNTDQIVITTHFSPFLRNFQNFGNLIRLKQDCQCDACSNATHVCV